MIRALVLLLSSIWPFHHKSAPTPVAPVLMPGESEVHSDLDCDHANGKWFYLGPDSMVGISSESCEEAFQRWTHEVPVFLAPRRLI